MGTVIDEQSYRSLYFVLVFCGSGFWIRAGISNEYWYRRQDLAISRFYSFIDRFIGKCIRLVGVSEFDENGAQTVGIF